MRSQVGEHLQELLEALLLQVAECAIRQLLRELLPPPIQPLPDCLIAHDLSGLRPAPVQDVLGIQHPLVHTLDLRQGLLPGGPLRDNRLEACHFLGNPQAYGSPLFSSCCRLASTLSNASAAAAAGYLNGNVPSKFSVVSTRHPRNHR